MNILQHIQNVENPQLKYKIPQEAFDLLYDWFKESNIEIAVFERDFFDSIIEAYRTLEHTNSRLEERYEDMRRGYYFTCAYLYLVYHHTDNNLLERFFKIQNFALSVGQGNLHGLSKWNSHGGLAFQYPHLFDILDIGSQLLGYYHAIHARVDSNISYLPFTFEFLKFNENEQLFKRVFNYVKEQDFEEKAYLFFILFKSKTTKYFSITNESGEYISHSKLIESTIYDEDIEIAFKNSIELCNALHGMNLVFENLLLVRDFSQYKKSEKKFAELLESFEEADLFLEKAKGNELKVAENLIYFIENTYLSDLLFSAETKYWSILLIKLAENIDCDFYWLEKKLNAEFGLTKRNSNMIFDFFYTRILYKLKDSLKYEDNVARIYENFLFKKTRKEQKPYSLGLSILRELAHKINDKHERLLQSSKLSDFYFTDRSFDWSYIDFPEGDRENKTIISFIGELKQLIPVELIKIPRRSYGDDDYICSLKFEEKEYRLSSSYLLTSVNELLEVGNSGYRLVYIPITDKNTETDNQIGIMSGLAFMSYSEFKYYCDNYLTDFLKNYKSTNLIVSGNELVTHVLTHSELGKIRYSKKNAIPFSEFKLSLKID
jgi:hypothetical protein